MNWKSTVEQWIPKPLIAPLKNLRQSIHLYQDSWAQAKRFNRSYSRIMPHERVRIETRVMFLSHQIEKGLSHHNFRYGFGKKVFNELPTLLTRLEQADLISLITLCTKKVLLRFMSTCSVISMRRKIFLGSNRYSLQISGNTL